jgi:hypothetical protein
MAVLAAASPVTETEPNGFDTPAPQAMGALGAGGFQVTGSLDPTSADGLDPADRDGYSFTMEAAGPVSATVDDGGAGKTFLLALSREDAGGPVILASALGPAPLTLASGSLATGETYRVGVAALSDGTALPYTLDLLPQDALPPWTAAPCPGDVPEAEPNGDLALATDLGDYTGVLCGAGSIAEVAPPGSGLDGDPDLFRFRNVLAVPAKLVVNADPGTLRVTISSLGLGTLDAVVEDTFGIYREIATPTLLPGMTYVVAIRGEQGTAPLDYDFHLEPDSPPPPPPPEPIALTKGRIRLAPGPSFRVTGTFAKGTGAGLAAGIPFHYKVRGLEETFGTGVLRRTGGGVLKYRAPKGTPGLKALVFHPAKGRLVLRGAGIDFLNVDPTDPRVEVEVGLGTMLFLGSEPGRFSPNGAVLRLE